MQSAHALISVDPGSDEAWFKLYGQQQLPSSDVPGQAMRLSDSLAKTRLC